MCIWKREDKMAHAFVQAAIKSSPVVVFTKNYCPYCNQVKALFDGMQVKYKEFDIENHPEMNPIQDYFKELTGARSVPRVFIGGKSIGGCDDTKALASAGKLEALIKNAV